MYPSNNLLDQFENQTLESLDHHDHVAVAWAIIQRDGIHGALASFPPNLKRFAESKGAHDLYNETITWLYLLLINERRSLLPEDHDWETFAKNNSDLLEDHNALLERYYSRDRLDSPTSKTTFLLPDPANTQGPETEGPKTEEPVTEGADRHAS